MAERGEDREILRPARWSYILLTLAVAVSANLLALPAPAQVLRPDLLALTLIYWVVYHPRRLGFLPAWLLGLVMDVANGTLFGQHALAYAVLMYLSILLHRRIVMFGMIQQMLHVFTILIASQAVMLVVRMAAGDVFPGISFFVPSVLGALLWPALFALIRMPLRPRPGADVA